MAYYSPNLVNICVDSINSPDFGGRLYHCYFGGPVNFFGIIQLVSIMDDLFDSIGFPQASTEPRRFIERNSNQTKKINGVQKMSVQEVTDQRGENGTFIVHVHYRQNATWQGSVVWADKNITQHFRSALELLKLIDSTFEENASGPSFKSNQPENF